MLEIFALWNGWITTHIPKIKSCEKTIQKYNAGLQVHGCRFWCGFVGGRRRARLAADSGNSSGSSSPLAADEAEATAAGNSSCDAARMAIELGRRSGASGLWRWRSLQGDRMGAEEQVRSFHASTPAEAPAAGGGVDGGANCEGKLDRWFRVRRSIENLRSCGWEKGEHVSTHLAKCLIHQTDS